MPNMSHYNRLLNQTFVILIDIFHFLMTFSLFPSLIPLTYGFVVEHCNGVCLLFSYPLRLNGTNSIPNELHRRGVNVNFSRFTVRTTPYFITRESGMNYTL